MVIKAFKQSSKRLLCVLILSDPTGAALNVCLYMLDLDFEQKNIHLMAPPCDGHSNSKRYLQPCYNQSKNLCDVYVAYTQKQHCHGPLNLSET